MSLIRKAKKDMEIAILFSGAEKGTEEDEDKRSDRNFGPNFYFLSADNYSDRNLEDYLWQSLGFRTGFLGSHVAQSLRRNGQGWQR